MWSSIPSFWLSAAMIAMAAFSIVLSRDGLLMAPLTVHAVSVIVVSVFFFALFLDLIKRVVRSLHRSERPTRAWLGHGEELGN